MITIEQAREAMKTGTTVQATRFGRTIEGTIAGVFVWAPVGYKQMGLVLPANAPEGDWEVVVKVEFPISDKFTSGDTYKLEELGVPQAADEEPAKPVTATLTSYQLSTNHTHVWPQERINDRLAWIFQHCRYGFWIHSDAEGAPVTMYVAILGPGDRVEIVYTLEH